MSGNQPTYGNGKICYVEMPSFNIEASAKFYEAVFGWKTRTRGDGATAFDDGVGQVSGAWTLDRKPSTGIGLVVYVMVDDIDQTIKKITGQGGNIVQTVDHESREQVALFSDPAGNILGLYQQPKQS